MKLASKKSHAPLFLAVGTLAAVLLSISHASAAIWALDSLTGAFALSGVFTVGVRLALGAPDRTVRRLWQFALGLLILVSISEFGGPWAERIETRLGIEDLDDCLILIAAFVTLWFTTKLDHIPVWARRILWTGFLLHLLATSLDVGDDGGSTHGIDQATTTSLSEIAQFLSLQLYLLGAITFVTSLRWQIFTLHQSPMALGDMARGMFSNRALLHKYRYPRTRALGFPGGKMLLSAVRLVLWFGGFSRVVRAQFGLDLWMQFVGICSAGFRHGLDAQAYYMFELYRPDLMQRAAAYVTRYETKNGLFKILTWQVPKRHRRTSLGDKLAVHELCEQFGIPHAPLLGIAKDGVVRLCCDPRVGLAQDLFVKPARSKGARGVEHFRTAGRDVYLDGDGIETSLARLLDRLAVQSKAGALLIQPRLTNHPGIQDLANESLIAIRIITCLDGTDRPIVTHGMLRVLTKLEPTWPMTLELAAPIDLSSGILGMMTGDKSHMLLDWFADHPITGAPVWGRAVPDWQEIKSVAIAAHDACPDRLLVGWDIALTPDGAMLLEGNAYPDVDFLQRVHRCPLGSSPMGVLLYDRLVELERRIVAGTVRGADDFD